MTMLYDMILITMLYYMILITTPYTVVYKLIISSIVLVGLYNIATKPNYYYSNLGNII